MSPVTAASMIYLHTNDSKSRIAAKNQARWAAWRCAITDAHVKRLTWHCSLSVIHSLYCGQGHFIAFRTLCKSQNTFQDADHRASDRSVHGQRWQISAFRNVSLSASLHRSQAPQPLRLQDFDCAKVRVLGRRCRYGEWSLSWVEYRLYMPG